MTKSRTLRKAGAVVLSLAMAFSVAGVAPSADAAAKTPALSAKKGTITVGKKKAVKVKNTTAKKVKKLVVSSNKKAVATVKKNSKVKFTVTGIKAGTAKITAKVTLKKAVAKKKVYTLKYKATVKKAATTPTEAPVVAVTGVTLSNTAPKVGDTISATVTPSNATNVTYAWYALDTANAEVAADAVALSTGASYTVAQTDLGKYLRVVVKGDNDSSATSDATAAVQAADGTELAITAEQTGSSTFKLTANQAVGASDTLKVVRGTSVAQTIGSTVWNDARTEATVTLGSKIGDSEYIVTLTPADTSKKAVETKFTGKTATLKSIDFKGTNLVLTNSQMTAGKVLIFGYNDFNEEISLSDITVYPTKGTAAYSAKDNTITITGPSMGKDTAGNDIIQPFTVGEKINVNVVYQDNGLVLQKNAELTVAAQAAVKELTFGDLKTSDASLKDQKVTLSNMATGTYYKEVSAKDQYGTTLTAADLNGMIWSTKNNSGTLYVSPTDAAGQYVYFTGFDTAADKKTVIAKFKGGNIGIPGKGIVTFNSVGGANVSTEIEVVDDPYIDEITVSAPSDIYAGTEAELTVTAKDQDGNAIDLYKYVAGSSAWASSYVFTKGGNNTNKQFASITATGGQVKVIKNSTKKTVTFKYKYTAAGTETWPVTDILTVKSAKVAVATVSLKVQKAGEVAGIQGLATGTKTVFDNAVQLANNTWTLAQKLVFKDNYGGTVATKSGATGRDGYPVQITANADKIKAQKATTAAGTDTILAYTVKLKNANTFDTTAAAIRTADHYTVELWKVTGAAAGTSASDADNTGTGIMADTGATIASLGTFEFDIKVASGLYKEGTFKATVKAGDELLYAGFGSADVANIVVTATDATLNQAVTVPTGSLSFTTSDTRATIAAGAVSMDTGRNAGDKTTTVEEGAVTIEVWYGGESVASVDVKYSDADPEAKAFAWKVTDVASGVTSDAADEIKVKADNNVRLLNATPAPGATSGTNAVAVTLADTTTATKNYTLSAYDQYGVPCVLTVTLNGATVVDNTALTNGILRAQAGKISKDVEITGAAGAAATSISAPTTLNSKTVAGAIAGVKTAGKVYLDNDGTYDTTHSWLVGSVVKNATSYTGTIDNKIVGGATYKVIFIPDDAEYTSVVSSGSVTADASKATTATFTVTTGAIDVNTASTESTIGTMAFKDQYGKEFTTAGATVALSNIVLGGSNVIAGATTIVGTGSASTANPSVLKITSGSTAGYTLQANDKFTATLTDTASSNTFAVTLTYNGSAWTAGSVTTAI